MNAEFILAGRQEFARIIKQARGSKSHREFVDAITGIDSGRGRGIQKLINVDVLQNLEECLILPPNIGTIGAIATQTWYTTLELIQILKGKEPLAEEQVPLTEEKYFELGCHLPTIEIATAIQLFAAHFAQLDSSLIVTSSDLLFKKQQYTKPELEKLARIIKASRGSSSYRDFALSIGNVSHSTVERIEKCDADNPAIGIIGALATQTPYSHFSLLAIMRGQSSSTQLITGKRYFDLGYRGLQPSSLILVNQKLIAFLAKSTGVAS